ncbi:hypothetical protein Leryth_025171 [Lithospermum erythrorhizon]|nr:hypothetical protein Leryth_025171 [Lithospermum erythrorhizon]
MMGSEVELRCEGNENGNVTVCSNVDDVKGDVYDVDEEADDLGNEILENLDSYLADIDDRLMISRMVNDAVTKGMVNAVEQEAAEVLAVKQLEIDRLKKSVLLRKVSDNQVGIPVANGKELDTMSLGGCSSCTDGLREHDKMCESVDRIKCVVSKQCARIKEEVDTVRGCNSMKRIESGEMAGFGGILLEKACENWDLVYEMLDGLQNTVNVMCNQVSDDLHVSSVSRRERQHQTEVQGDIETKVKNSFIRSLLEESDEKSGSQNVNWQQKLDDLSLLQSELNKLLKSLNNPEIEHLISNGSLNLDSSHSKFHGNHVMTPTSTKDGNGIKEDSKINVPEALDAAQFKHLNREELVSYFNLTIRKMRRDHESIVAKMTDDYFTLKRAYLKVKERSPSLSHLKDSNEVDIVKKKVVDLIAKLDKILSESVDVALLPNGGSISKLKDRVARLASENLELKDLLKVQGYEISCLWSQISDAKEKMLQHSLVEANMMKVIENLNGAFEDEQIEDFITEKINKCFFEELIEQITLVSEESNMEMQNVKEMYELILRGAVSNDKCDIGVPYMKSLITQDICGLVYKETFQDAQQKLREFYSKYLLENEKNLSHEKKALEKETRLWKIIEEKERLGKQVLELDSAVKEKEKLVGALSASLASERDHFEQVSKEVNSLREETSCQQMVASQCTIELESIKDQLADAFEQIKHKKIENFELNQILENKIEELKQIDAQREALHELSEERYKHLVRAEGKSKELENHMKAVILNVEVFSNTLVDFENRVEDRLKTNGLRLEALSSQIKSVIGNANMLRRSVLVYKDQLERRSADIQKAETEVDLLGDEVDVLLGLLEKIYIGLDHYSPVLKHYPGIMEILQLVRRELSGSRPKSV